MTLVDSQEHGVLRFVRKMRWGAGGGEEMNLLTTETEVLSLASNRPAGGCGRDAGRIVNINYAYCTSGGLAEGRRGFLKWRI
jgi:hypothetical protein